MNNYVIEPIEKEELKKIFNQDALDVIKYYILKSLFAQPEKKNQQKNLPIQIPKEHIEQWVVQSINATSVGSGSYPVDVIINDVIGADVKMLSCKVDEKSNSLSSGESGETSLAQKFKDDGGDLDISFKNKQYKDILQFWIKTLHDKYDKVRKEYQSMECIYYIFILRAGNNFHLCAFNFNEKMLNKLTIKKNTEKSIYIDNMIDDKYGKVKIYLSKKRMELRLLPKNLFDDNLTLNISTDFNLEDKDIYNDIKNQGIIEALDASYDNIKNIKFTID